MTDDDDSLHAMPRSVLKWIKFRPVNLNEYGLPCMRCGERMAVYVTERLWLADGPAKFYGCAPCERLLMESPEMQRLLEEAREAQGDD